MDKKGKCQKMWQKNRNGGWIDKIGKSKIWIKVAEGVKGHLLPPFCVKTAPKLNRMEEVCMNKIKRGLWTIGLIICACIWMFSAYSLYQYLAEARQRGQEFADMAEIVENMQNTKTGDENEKEEMQGQGGDESAILSEYAALYNQNEDMVGWISIEGTVINYPVMHTPENPDFYLRHNFEKEYSDYGVPYVAGNCRFNPRGDNIIIYGHHMKNGTMFGTLTDYADKDFYVKHKIIQFDTLTEKAEYEIMAVFKTTVYDGNGFAFYEFVEAESEQDFQEYIEKCKELSLYDTGITAAYGDELLTLSTCEYSSKNGRMVVVGKKK